MTTRRAIICLAALMGSFCGAMAQQGYFQPTTAATDQFGNQVDPAKALDNLNDSTVEVVSPAPKLYQWTVEERLGIRHMQDADTISLNFQNSNQDYGMTGSYNYLGNLGLPRLSRIFSERSQTESSTIFLTPFSHFFTRPQDQRFTNSNIPYTNLTYYKAGDKITGEERFKSYFSVNAGKKFAFGFKFDYLYARGYYASQSAAHFNAGVFASYISDRYQLHAVYNNFYLKNNENGGIKDDRYITRPEDMAEGGKAYEGNNIPVNLETTSNRNHDFYVYLTQRYALGFNREVMSVRDSGTQEGAPERKDTVRSQEYVPVTSIIHTLKVERARHSFHSSDTGKGVFPEGRIEDEWNGKDSTSMFSISNTIGISLLEGFNKYAKAGLTAYLSHRTSQYRLMSVDTAQSRRGQVIYREQDLRAGAELSKTQGRVLHYTLRGEIGLAGIAKGAYLLEARGDLNVSLGRFDTLRLDLLGRHRHEAVDFYMRHYHSNFYTWDHDGFNKQTSTRLEARLRLMRLGTSLRLGVENLKNYTYFASTSLPRQEGGNIQVAEAALSQDFRLGIFHLDNVVTFQKSSNEKVLPLPKLSTYHNLYLLTKVAKKILTLQIGADLRYFTSYAAPAYSPGIQQFRVQDPETAVMIGNYPIINVYANLHLKRTRIFVEMYHINAGSGNRAYFLAPHYPLAGRTFKLGISWNFYD